MAIINPENSKNLQLKPTEADKIAAVALARTLAPRTKRIFAKRKKEVTEKEEKAK